MEEFITSVEKIRRRNAHVLNSKNNKKWILSLDENKCKNKSNLKRRLITSDRTSEKKDRLTYQGVKLREV